MGKKSNGKKKRNRANVVIENRKQSLPVGSKASASAVLLPQPFPPHLARPNDGFLCNNLDEYKDSFQAALEGPYEGLVVDNSLQNIIKQDTVQDALQQMLEQDYFRTDVTQPFGLGTKCAKTYVTRCLVGEPGTTYKYLGLRMFAHPYPTKNGGDGMVGTIQQLGQVLTNRTRTHLQTLTQKRKLRGAPPTRGRSIFDICLINRMEPLEERKPEPMFDHKDNNNKATTMKTSVSWHADSSLEHYSTIAVYQTLMVPEAYSAERKQQQQQQQHADDSSATKDGSDEWLVALRVAHHSEGPTQSSRRGSNIESAIVNETPPIAVSLPSGSAYYLLDDFNHHHQHTVLSSSSDGTNGGGGRKVVRYSCTFRLLRDSHNINDWMSRGKTACGQFHKKGSKIWRSEQLLLTEIESEWLRQFYVQGSKNYSLLWETYWKEPIQQLLKIWSQLERRTLQTIELLRLAAEAKCGLCTGDNTTNGKNGPRLERKARERRKKALVTVEELLSRRNNPTSDKDDTAALVLLYEPMAKLLEERAEMRDLWEKREKDFVFHEMPPDCRPLSTPFKFRTSRDEQITGEYGTSPLPGTPTELREIAHGLRKCGQAYQDGDANKLATTTCCAIESQKPAVKPDNNSHAKSLEWIGWKEHEFGLELQQPWAGAVVDGSKSIETRLYNLPPALLGKKIIIIESPSGKAGVSSLGNVIQDFAQAKIIGWCRFASVKKYTTRESFEKDKALHLVTRDSGYGWKKGHTKQVFGWVVGECGRSCPDTGNTYSSAARRMRSLFEMKRNDDDSDTSTAKKDRNQGPKKNAKRNSNSSLESNKKPKKKRKRY